MAETYPPDGQINGGGALVVASSETVGSKRQRRPSVRLGDIGDQPYDSHARRTNKQWKLTFDVKKESNKSSKTRALTNFNASGEFNETLEGEGEGEGEGEDKEGNLDSVAIGSWRVKDSKKRGSAATKRVRSNWVSKADEMGTGEEGEKYSGGEDVDDRFREFDIGNSESPSKEQSPINSLENLVGDGHGSERNEREVVYNRRGKNIRARVSENRDHTDGVEFSGPSDTEGGREWKSGTSVRIWLNSLGLGRYAPVFEIHEVDDEVLPMLTLEDLKDMGINAVGSRRKMYCAIQKLGKGFS